ncbi:carboxylesterase family protein [Bradyrhizobium sp. CCGUVB1N3]|uniref:carboxylesterase/lipase family protein n=1 Tax=Bradyrhizobium sp. CCGUVB1N3 TaxID=2949629 RepID=UPI0020B2636E|nr:carboxylesterase family protein [Bradyrhizobium sp. CCGUVB1N3]MCP3469011.1 carboxylesterase family protein [Bradyrhizobium sp. CCGUVB1N3]
MEFARHTPFGTLVGRQTRDGYSFLGIPYAEPPIGPLRFCKPIARRRTTATVDATEPRPAPLQAVGPTLGLFGDTSPKSVSEDCLYLNVWTPAPDVARRPVLVHLFGGGFQRGSATEGVEDAAALSNKSDCVIVRVGFRVGVLGFLHLGDVWGEPYGAGNVGLLDVVAALEWVAENISALGGDPDNVTIFGISSGAFMATALFAIPAARSLFQRAFLQSGSASRVFDRTSATDRAREFLAAAGVAIGDRRALEALPPDRILDAEAKILASDLGARNAPGGRALGIVEDGTTLVEHPLEVFRRGICRDKPIVLGSTRDESRMWFSLGVMAIPERREALAAEMDRFFQGKGDAIFASYRARAPGADLAQLREQFLTDVVYRLPAVRTALAHAHSGGAAYLFRFDWAPAGELSSFGAAHGFDEPFVWGVEPSDKLPLMAGSHNAAMVARQMSDALVAFARNGAPGWPAVAAPSPLSKIFGGGEEIAALDDLLLTTFEGADRR